LLLEDQWQHNGEGGKVIGIATPKCSIKDYRSETQNQQNNSKGSRRIIPRFHTLEKREQGKPIKRLRTPRNTSSLRAGLFHQTTVPTQLNNDKISNFIVHYLYNL